MKRTAFILLLIVPTMVSADTYSLLMQASYQIEMVGVTPIPVIAYHPSDFFGWEFGLSLHFDAKDPDLSEPDWIESWSCFTLLLNGLNKKFYPVVSLGIKARLVRPEPLFGMMFGTGTELALKKIFLRCLVSYNCLDNMTHLVKDIQTSLGLGVRF